MSLSSPPPSARLRWRLLSCNILAGASIGRYREYVTRSFNAVWPGKTKLSNLDHLAQYLPEFDLIALQEADAGSLRSGFLNQTRYLAEAAGMPFWSHQPNRPVAGLAHSSNGLISRLEPRAVFDYPLPSRIPGRGAMLASFGHGEQQLAVMVAHLSLSATARRQQLSIIAEILQTYPHAILMGDLNAELESAELQHFFSCSDLRPAAAPPPTFPSWNPRKRLDHILVSPQIQVERIWTLPPAFSDHLSLAAEISLPEQLQLPTAGS